MKLYSLKASAFTLLLFCITTANAFTINLRVPQKTLANSTVYFAVTDVQKLLATATKDSVYINGNTGSVEIELSEVEQGMLTYLDHDSSVYAIRDYAWKGTKQGTNYKLELTCTNQFGVSAGLYGLLQEVLGFNFYHPREMQTPDLKEWPLGDGFSYISSPRFEVTGFHLHTQHPLELTEALMNCDYLDGIKMINQYIDWLARNRQNYFEFNLLEGINRKRWPAYAKLFVDYGHERGIIMGVDLSLHMIQQKAFQLYRFPFKSFRTKKNQIRRNINNLCEAPWDVWAVEFSASEFSKGNKKKKQKLQLFLLGELKKHHVKLTGREHVVKEENMLSGKVQADAAFDSVQNALDRQRTILVHTVMFYTLTDTFAPVYGNHDLLHMQDVLHKNIKERETWYYPESAYWVTFDASVPLFLPSYLSARLEDILFTDPLKVKGHITFSSGWEWGYWLFDWSIANWSWKSTISNKEVIPDALQYVRRAAGNESYAAYFDKQLQLHDTWVKSKNLIKYLDTQTITDEMPGKFNLPFHPRPDWTYKWLRRKASLPQLDTIQQEVQQLSMLYNQFDALDKTLPEGSINGKVLQEFNDGLTINKYRALHRYSTLNYIIEKRRSEINKTECGSCAEWMAKATFARGLAQSIVTHRETDYRYSIEELSTWHKSHTSYTFGYLYTVHNLHFWNREEQQAIKNKWSPFYKCIWNVPKIVGLID